MTSFWPPTVDDTWCPQAATSALRFVKTPTSHAPSEATNPTSATNMSSSYSLVTSRCQLDRCVPSQPRLRRVEERFAGVQYISKPSVLQLYGILDDPNPFRGVPRSVFRVKGAAIASDLEDKALFLAITQRPGQKPAPFIPILDANFEVWCKKVCLIIVQTKYAISVIRYQYGGHLFSRIGQAHTPNIRNKFQELKFECYTMAISPARCNFGEQFGEERKHGLPNPPNPPLSMHLRRTDQCARTHGSTQRTMRITRMSQRTAA